MATSRVFISFDFDHDEELKHSLVGQARQADSPFSISDWSIKQELPGDWVEKVRQRIRKVDQVIVMCGKHTHQATGVATELGIAKKEGKPYFLLTGRPNDTCTRPTTASSSDKMYKWSWPNLQKLIGGAR